LVGEANGESMAALPLIDRKKRLQPLFRRQLRGLRSRKKTCLSGI
jgi:hypothetical protein